MWGSNVKSQVDSDKLTCQHKCGFFGIKSFFRITLHLPLWLTGSNKCRKKCLFSEYCVTKQTRQ